MKAYNEVYRGNKKAAQDSARRLYEQQRIKLVNAVKVDMGVNDFDVLSESERNYCRSLIREMWSPETGINQKGLAFLNEGKTILTKDAPEEQIQKKFEKMVSENLATIMSAVVLGENGGVEIGKIKSAIEAEIKGKLSSAKCKAWTYNVLSKQLQRKVKRCNF